MKRYIIAYACFLLPMLAIDSVWLFTMSKRFYAKRIGTLLADSPRLAPAGVFYLIYALGASILVVVRAVDSGSGYLEVFLWGALLGLFAYATYDLTNQATLIWGALLTGVVSIISVSLTRLF
jgi:uncharacterized membrane protein